MIRAKKETKSEVKSINDVKPKLLVCSKSIKGLQFLCLNQAWGVSLFKFTFSSVCIGTQTVWQDAHLQSASVCVYSVCLISWTIKDVLAERLQKQLLFQAPVTMWLCDVITQIMEVRGVPGGTASEPIERRQKSQELQYRGAPLAVL